MVLSNGLTEGKQCLCSPPCGSACVFLSAGGDHSGMDHPSSTTTHLQPCSALESWRNWASWWIHGAVIRLTQAKHTHGALSSMLFSVTAHSWRNPSLCECLAVCLSPTLSPHVSLSLALFGMFRSDDGDISASTLIQWRWIKCCF